MLPKAADRRGSYLTEEYCPQCKAAWVCPCKSCDKAGVSKWVFGDNDAITCACGFSRHCDWWLDRGWELMKKVNTEEASDGK